jgi:outer membrane lipoprotein-sorting protein
MSYRVTTRGARVATVATLLALLGVAAATAQTVDDVVRRYLEARGGLARLRSVQSLRLTGTMELPGVLAPFVLELKRPNKMRTEFTVEGRKGIRAFDGRTAWVQLPLPGESPSPMDPDEAAEARAQADVDLSPLVDAAAKGYSIELVGRDRLPGGDTWKLVVRGGDEPPRTLYLDAKSHLAVQTVDRRNLDGKEVEFVTEVGDYRAVNGLVFPHRIEVGPRGSPERQRLDIQTIEVNPSLDDTRFAMPSGRPGVPARAKRTTPPVLP